MMSVRTANRSVRLADDRQPEEAPRLWLFYPLVMGLCAAVLEAAPEGVAIGGLLGFFIAWLAGPAVSMMLADSRSGRPSGRRPRAGLARAIALSAHRAGG